MIEVDSNFRQMVVKGCRDCLLPVEEAACDALCMISSPVPIVPVEAFGLESYVESLFCLMEDSDMAMWRPIRELEFDLVEVPLINSNVLLHPSQSYVSLKAVLQISQKYSNKISVPEPRVVPYQGDFFIVDGHHRFGGAIVGGLDFLTCKVYYEK